MQRLSRRQIARYAVDQMGSGTSQKILARRLAATLIENRKTGQVTELLEDIAYELESRGLSVNATVSSVSSITEQLQRDLSRFIADQTGAKTVELTHQTDESLIGGIKIETAKYSWDETIKRRLTDIKEAF